MIVILALTAVTNQLGYSVITVIFLSVFIITFNLGIGSISFIHAQETCVDAGVGFSTKSIFQNIVFSALLSSWILLQQGEQWSFLLEIPITGATWLYMFFTI